MATPVPFARLGVRLAAALAGLVLGAAVVLMAQAPVEPPAADAARFAAFLDELKTEAVRRGISEAVAARALDGLEPRRQGPGLRGDERRRRPGECRIEGEAAVAIAPHSGDTEDHQRIGRRHTVGGEHDAAQFARGRFGGHQLQQQIVGVALRQRHARRRAAVRRRDEPRTAHTRHAVEAERAVVVDARQAIGEARAIDAHRQARPEVVGQFEHDATTGHGATRVGLDAPGEAQRRPDHD